jgi:hypothetical protein
MYKNFNIRALVDSGNGAGGIYEARELKVEMPDDWGKLKPEADILQ